MRKANVLILGATSSIARESAAELARQGCSLTLAARDREELRRISEDLQIRYSVAVTTAFFDASDWKSHKAFFEEAEKRGGAFTAAIVAFGDMGEGLEACHDFTLAEKIISCNYVGACSIITEIAKSFSKRGEGSIVAITSVAGERGRKSNYIYGSAKGALTLFLGGLRGRLHPLGVKVVTVKLGFVDTAMTFGMPGLFLVASPKTIGKKIAEATKGKKDVLYLPGFWRTIMAIIKSIPEPLFKRLSL